MANRETTLYRKLSQADQIKEFDDETGIVTALTNSMGIVDLDNDRLLPGAFENSMSRLEEDTVSVLWGHDSKEVVGKVLDGYEIGLQDGRSVLYLEMLFNLCLTAYCSRFALFWFVKYNRVSSGFLCK